MQSARFSRLAGFFKSAPKFAFFGGDASKAPDGAAAARPGVLRRFIGATLGLTATVARWGLIFMVASMLYSSYKLQTYPDEQRYHRSTALYQQDLSAVSDVLRMVQTDPQVAELRATWGDLSNEDRMAGLQRIQDRMVSNYDGIAPVGVTGFHAGPYFCLAGGMCTTRGGVEIRFKQVEHDGEKRLLLDTSFRSPVKFNTHWIADWNDFEDVLNVLVHETTHSIQLQLLEKAVTSQDTLYRSDIEAFAKGAAGYVKITGGSVRYFTNPLEEHAFTNGNCAQEALKILDDGERMAQLELKQPVKAVLGACFDHHRAGKGISRVTDADILAKDRQLQRQTAPTHDANPVPQTHPGF